MTAYNIFAPKMVPTRPPGPSVPEVDTPPPITNVGVEVTNNIGPPLAGNTWSSWWVHLQTSWSLLFWGGLALLIIFLLSCSGTCFWTYSWWRRVGLAVGFPSGDVEAAWDFDPASEPPATSAVHVPSLEEQEEVELASLASSMRSAQECVEAHKSLEEDLAMWRKAVTRIRHARRKRRRDQLEGEDLGEDGSSRKARKKQED